MNTQKSLIAITSFTATFVALCAAVFSVTGIAKLFAGAALSAAIMAAALELGKIVSISFLYQYWRDIPKTLKGYLLTAAVVLMIITSAGIYGYLSSAYAKVAAAPLTLNADIQTTQGRVASIEQDIKRKEDRLNQLINLRSQQETRLDNLVTKSTTGNSSAIRSAQNSLSQADRNVSSLQNEISKLAEQKDSLNAISISKQVEIETNGDVGTFMYIAKVLNTDLDTVVKWFTLIIVLVFDPLAVALVVSVNFLIKNKPQNKSSTEHTEIQSLIPSTELVEVQTTHEEKPEEPYQIYIPEKQAEESVSDDIQKYLDLNNNGIPDWMEPNYNWDDTAKWINNPVARHFKQQIIDKRN